MLKKMKIQSQMLLMSLMCGFSIVAMTLYALHEIGKVQSLEIQNERNVKMLHIYDRASERIRQINIQESRFVQNGDLYFSKKYEEDRTKLHQDLTSLYMMDPAGDYQTIKSDMTSFDDLMSQVFNLRHQIGSQDQHGVAMPLVKSAKEIQDQLTELHGSNNSLPFVIIDDLRSHILTMYMDEVDIINENHATHLAPMIDRNLAHVRTLIVSQDPSGDQSRALFLALDRFEQHLSEFLALKVQLESAHLSFIQTKNNLLRELGQKSYGYEKAMMEGMNRARSERTALKYNLIIVMIVTLMAAMMAGALVCCTVSNQYQLTLSYLRKLAKGDYDFKISAQTYADEMDAITRNLKTVQDRMEELEEPAEVTLQKRADRFEKTNVIDFRQKMFEMSQRGVSHFSHHPK